MPQVRRTWGRAESRENPQGTPPARRTAHFFHKSSRLHGKTLSPASALPRSDCGACGRHGAALCGTLESDRGENMNVFVCFRGWSCLRSVGFGMHLGRGVCTWGSEGGGDAPGGAHRVRGCFHVNTGSFSRKKVSIRIPFVSCLYPIVFKNTCLILRILDVYSCSKIPDCILKCVFSCIPEKLYILCILYVY